MGSNGADQVLNSTSHGADCSKTTVEIKIKTLDAQTYTLHVDKCVPVPQLKEQIASVTGVVSEHQRLICRGRVMKDDQLLSAYHVEDGHTLHLVVRQPVPPLSDIPLNHPAMDHTLSAGHSQGSRRGSSVVIATFNIAEQGDGGSGVLPDFSQIFSTLLGSVGVQSSDDGPNLREPPLEGLSRTFGLSGLRLSSGQQLNEPTLHPQQPPVMADSLTTLSQYLSRLRSEFFADGFDGNNSHIAGTHGSNMQESDVALQSATGQSGFARPAFLAEVILSTRQLLIEQAAECLSHLARQLEDQENVTDPSTRVSIQLNGLRSGTHLQNLGALLLELGRTTMSLQLGEAPADAVVDAGPPLFISTSGPNPMMVQPAFQPGTSFGATPIRTAEVPRNASIRTQTGSERGSNGPQPSAGETDPAVSGGANFFQQAAATASRNPSIRVVPVRTVVRAVPAPFRHSSSDLSHSPVGLLYPVLARLRHVSSGNSPVSSERNSSQPIDVGGGVNSQSMATNSAPPEAANTQEATQRPGEGGAFLSNVLHQILRFLPRNAARGSDRASSQGDTGNGEASSVQAPDSDVGTSSRQRVDRPSPDPSSSHPSTKRQRRE